MTKPTILVATWSDGLFAVTGNGRTQEIANQPVRGLAPDGRGGALAIVGRHSLRRRAPSGEWATVATSEFELSCCMAVRDAIYVGTDDARMLRLSHEGGVLDLSMVSTTSRGGMPVCLAVRIGILFEKPVSSAVISRGASTAFPDEPRGEAPVVARTA